MRKELIFILGLLTFVSCRKDAAEGDIRETGHDYFNARIGSYSVYHVFEVIYDDFTQSEDTFNYQIKEHNESYFTDNQGRNAVRIDRYQRLTDTSAWKYINTWYATLDKKSAERVEDNKRYIKLSFPVTPEAVWNANALNMDFVNNVYYNGIHRRYLLDSFSFDSSVTVLSNPVNNVNLQRSYREVYALHAGLIYSEIKHIIVDPISGNKRGHYTRRKLISYVP